MASKTTTTPRETLPIAELLETLELLVSQARTYERAISRRCWSHLPRLHIHLPNANTGYSPLSHRG